MSSSSLPPPAPVAVERSTSSIGSIGSLTSPTPISSSRKSELLMEARSARQTWLTSTSSSPNSTSNDDAAPSVGAVSILSQSNLTTSNFQTSLQPLLSNLYGPTSTPHLNSLTLRTIPSSSPLLTPTYGTTTNSTDYNTFINLLSTPSSSNLVSSLQNFVSQFHLQTTSLLQNRSTILESKRIAPFKFEAQDEENEESKSANSIIKGYINTFLPQLSSSLTFQNTELNLKKLLTMFIRRKVFQRTWELTEDKEDDIEFEKRLGELAFISFEHFDITCLQSGERDSIDSISSTSSKEPQSDLWSIPLNTLKSIGSFKSPSEKLDCVIKTSKEITAALSSVLEGDELPGADDFLPAFILCILKSNPKQFKSNLNYIQSYIDDSSLISEAGYVLTHVISGVHFLSDLEETSLSISKEEFREGVEKKRKEIELKANQKKEEERKERRRRLRSYGEEERREVKEVSARAVREARLNGDMSKLDNVNYVESEQVPPRVEVKKKYSYLMHTPKTLGVNDVEGLLREYKDLVYTCERLVKERDEGERRRRKEEREGERKRLEGIRGEFMD